MSVNSISGRIEEIKKRFGLNNVKLAEKAGVSRMAVGRWINDSALPSATALNRLTEELGINPGWIETGKGDMLIVITSDPFSLSLQELGRFLNEEDKELLLQTARRLAEKNLIQGQK